MPAGPVRGKCRHVPSHSPSVEKIPKRALPGSIATRRSPTQAMPYRLPNSPGPAPLRPKVARCVPSGPKARISEAMLSAT
jgi:hypothetical protein